MSAQYFFEKSALALAAVLSGGAALVYETLWTREFSLILGSTVGAASVTFSAFLTGLALGAYSLGRFIEKHEKPMLVYFAVECLIGLSSLGTGLFFRHGAAGGLGLFLPAWVDIHAASAGVAFGAVLVPTFFMGGTLPLLLVSSKYYGGNRSFMGRLYAANTLGGALGTVLCAFCFMRLFGISGSLYLAAGMNASAAALCLLLQAVKKGGGLPGKTVPDREGAREGGYPEDAFLFLTAAFSGFCTLGLEVVWIRLGSFFLGNRIYAFSLILASVLLILAAGSWIASGLSSYVKRKPYLLFAWIFVFAGAGIKVSSILGTWWILRQGDWECLFPGIDRFLVLYRFLEIFLVLVPAMLPLGVLFPLSVIFSRNSIDHTGTTTGRMYLVNTAGSVLGSLAVGLYGLRFSGSMLLNYLFHFIGILTAALLFYYSWSRFKTGIFASTAGLFMCVMALVAGKFDGIVLVPEDEGEMVRYEEDEYGIFKILRLKSGHLKVTNNRTELVFHLGAARTSYVQQMQAHLGMAYFPDAKQVLVLGSGYGITAGAFTLYPGIESVDAVEIIPAMVRHASDFEPYNFSYHKDKRVRLVQEDARYFLLRSGKKYDVISANVTDPHIPGASSLFHKEFYGIVKDRLNAGGIFIQHAFGEDAGIVLKTLNGSFPHVLLYPAYRNGYNAVASSKPLFMDLAKFRVLLNFPKVKQAFEGLGFSQSLDALKAFSSPLTREDLPWCFLDSVPEATDNNPLIEFAWHGNAYKNLFSNE